MQELLDSRIYNYMAVYRNMFNHQYIMNNNMKLKSLLETKEKEIYDIILFHAMSGWTNTSLIMDNLFNSEQYLVSEFIISIIVDKLLEKNFKASYDSYSRTVSIAWENGHETEYIKPTITTSKITAPLDRNKIGGKTPIEINEESKKMYEIPTKEDYNHQLNESIIKQVMSNMSSFNKSYF